MTRERTRQRQHKLEHERKCILNRTLGRNKKSTYEHNKSHSVFTRLSDIERREIAEEKLTIMDPIVKKIKLDKHNRHLKLLIAIIEESKLENSQSQIQIWGIGILQEVNYRSFNYTNNTDYYINYIYHTRLTSEDSDAVYENEIVWLQELEKNILAETDKLSIDDTKLKPYINDYAARVDIHKKRVEAACGVIKGKKQDEFEERFELPNLIAKLLENDIFKPGKSPETVRQLVALEKKLNDTYAEFKAIEITVAALQQRQDRLSQQESTKKSTNERGYKKINPHSPVNVTETPSDDDQYGQSPRRTN